MMTFNLLIALAAAAASALMFASIISGALISVVLFYLAPLPLMVAALGFGSLNAALGGLVISLGLAAWFGIPYAVAFFIGVALPAWWLGHLVLLGRDAAPTDKPAQIEWYPLGRLLAWIAAVGALTTIGALLTLGTDGDAINDAMRRGLARVIGARGSSDDAEQLINAIVAVAPAAAATVATVMLTINLWLAAKITLLSGRLKRPWPELKTAALPGATLAALGIALALCFVPGLIAIVAKAAAAALAMGYALHGLAALHTILGASPNRLFWLISAYAVLLAFGWPVIVLIALGLIDAVFDLRARFAKGAAAPPSAGA